MPTAPGVCVRACVHPLLQVCVYLDGSNAENKIALLVILCIIMYVKKIYSKPIFSLQNRYFSLQNRSFFFHLGLVLCFYLHLINRRPHLSESRHLIFLSEKSIFYE